MVLGAGAPYILYVFWCIDLTLLLNGKGRYRESTHS